jgi:hypothetical protein
VSNLAPFTLWSDAARNRFFLVPDEPQLPSGDFRIHTITGRHQNVDPAELSPYEISEAEAKKWLEHQLSGLLDSARGAVERFVEKLSSGKDDPIGALRDAVVKLEAATERLASSSNSISKVDAAVLMELSRQVHRLEARLREIASADNLATT